MSLTEDLAAIRKECDALEREVYTTGLQPRIDAVIASVPEPDEAGTPDERVARLLLRARCRHLLPTYSKAAEADLGKALKLKPQSVEAWYLMSESCWKRNALKEARDALDTALRSDPKYTPALVQMSRILRSASTSMEPDAKHKALAESVAKAKEAVALGGEHQGDAWGALGMALMQLTCAQGMEVADMKKALQAFNLAHNLSSTASPDLLYNRGVVNKFLGNFGAALTDFQAAYAADPTGLQTARTISEQLMKLLRGAHHHVTKPRDKDFTRAYIKPLPDPSAQLKLGGGPRKQISLAAAATAPKLAAGEPSPWVALKVVELVSQPQDVPLVYAMVDKSGQFSLLLMYKVANEAIKAHDVVAVAVPPTTITAGKHKFTAPPPEDDDAAKDAAVGELSLECPVIIPEPTTVFVNGRTIPPKLFQAPSMSVRAFQ